MLFGFQMSDQVSPSILELLEWVSLRGRTYAEVMEAWRSTCPRHSVWEDAWSEGLIQVADDGAGMADAAVTLTSKGATLLAANRRPPKAKPFSAGN